MNKTILFLFIAVLMASYAQAQVKFGVRAGAGFTDLWQINEKANLATSTTMIPGFQAGVIVEYIGGQFGTNSSTGFQTGLLFAKMGGKTSLIGGGERTTNLNYLQLPLNFVIKRNFSRNALIGYIGPYFGYAISGKNKTESRTIEVEKDITFGTGSDAFMKGFDAGIVVGGGFQFGNFQIAPELKGSLLSLSNYKDVKMTNIGIFLNVTYLFGR